LCGAPDHSGQSSIRPEVFQRRGFRSRQLPRSIVVNIQILAGVVLVRLDEGLKTTEKIVDIGCNRRLNAGFSL
jgi:hypothetical protein